MTDQCPSNEKPMNDRYNASHRKKKLKDQWMRNERPMQKPMKNNVNTIETQIKTEKNLRSQ